MARIAKVSLSADIEEFKTKMKETKKIFSDMSSMKVNPKIDQEFKDAMEKDLAKAAEVLEGKIKDIEVAVEKFSKKGKEAYKSDQVRRLVSEHGKYNRRLEETKKLLSEITGEKKKQETQEEKSQKSGMRSSGASIAGNVGRRAMGAAGTVGIAMGVGALYNRGQNLANSGMGVRELSGGNSIGDERSKLGFTKLERLEQGRSQALSAERELSSEDLSKRIDFSEQAQRAYGIDQGQTSQTMSVARKAGVQDEQKMVAVSIGEAVAAGLTGSSINEYLAEMTGHMSQMSKGVDINDTSLRGISSSMADLDFFKKDPSRIFDAMNQLDSTFRGGDEFQQMIAAQSIQSTTDGTSGPAAIEFRKSMGLNGKLDDQTKSNLKKAGVDVATLETSGKDILKEQFRILMKRSEGMSGTQRLFEFKEATGMDSGAAASIYGKLSKGEDLTDKDMESMLSPEDQMKAIQERANNNMKNLDGGMKTLHEQISTLNDTMATKVATGITGITEQMAKLGLSMDSLANVGLGITTALALKAGTDMLGGIPGLPKGTPKIPTGGAGGGGIMGGAKLGLYGMMLTMKGDTGPQVEDKDASSSLLENKLSVLQNNLERVQDILDDDEMSEEKRTKWEGHEKEAYANVLSMKTKINRKKKEEEGLSPTENVSSMSPSENMPSFSPMDNVTSMLDANIQPQSDSGMGVIMGENVRATGELVGVMKDMVVQLRKPTKGGGRVNSIPQFSPQRAGKR